MSSGFRRSFSFIVCLLVLSAIGCAPQTLYRWGDYESKLHKYYDDPTTQASYLYAVREIVANSEEDSMKPPPGLCLEYGIALYQFGYQADVTVNLEQEAPYWPESAGPVGVMMKRMDEMGMASPPEDGDEATMYWLPGKEKPGRRPKRGSNRRRTR